MVVENKQIVKNLQKSFILLLNEYEKSKAESFADTESNESIRMSNLMLLSNEIHSKVNEKTLELIFFKYFIGELTINKIIFELYNKTV
jgi:hypothetical protein